MNKQELVSTIASQCNIPKTQADAALTAVLGAMSEALAKGDKVSLVGFGTFSVGKRAARVGRNPATGKEINIAARNTPKFKAGKSLTDLVNK